MVKLEKFRHLHLVYHFTVPLIDHGSEEKKSNDIKMCPIKSKLKFKNYKNCLEAAQLDNKINYLEKNKINVDSLKNILQKS